MPRFLSSEWVQEIDRELHGISPLPGQLASASIVLQQIVTGSPNGDVAYYLVFANGAGSARAGMADSPTVTFSADYETAVAINRGDTSAQNEFMTGRLHLDGDASALLEIREAVAMLADLFKKIRSKTKY